VQSFAFPNSGDVQSSKRESLDSLLIAVVMFSFIEVFMDILSFFLSLFLGAAHPQPKQVTTQATSAPVTNVQQRKH
jgi:hypothetical protein